MRVKILRRNDTGTVLLVYPSTLDEHRQALETLGRGARPAAGHYDLAMKRTGSGPPQGCYVVTTEEQRHRWRLPDLAACGRARVVNESQALELLDEPGAWSAAAELLADAEAVAARSDADPDTSGLAAVRDLVASGPRVQQKRETEPHDGHHVAREHYGLAGGHPRSADSGWSHRFRFDRCPSVVVR